MAAVDESVTNQEVAFLEVHDLAGCNNDAAASFRSGDHVRATQLFAQTFKGCCAILGMDHPATLTVAGNLGVALIKGSRYGEGLELIIANLADRVRVLGDEDSRTLAARDALAVAYRRAGQINDAVTLSRTVTLQRSQILGPTHPDTLTSRMGLALAAAAAGDAEAAAMEMTAVINDAEQAHGIRHPRTVALLECAVNIAR
jgi:hypothetical protein